ncbi:hypothetical protein BH23VER1_BH23VER1_14370 [soil metagenome]
MVFRALMRPNFRSLLALAALACAAALAGCATPPSKAPAPYYVKAYKPNNPANVRVAVSLRNQAVYVMEGDRPLMAAACTVGKPSSPTPKGTWTIYSKQKHRRKFTNPGKGYPMGYWCEFKSAYGIHAGWVHPQPRSQGCIRLHFNAAPKFFELVREGTKVHIADTQPQDATIGSDLARPQDYNNPEFPPEILNTNRIFSVYQGPIFES